MSNGLRQPMTPDAFLAWEALQPLRYEFDGFQPVAMTGGTANHARIQRNLLRHLGNRLAGTPCEVFGSDLKVATAVGFRYLDAFVACAPLPAGTAVITAPVVVFEVLSPATQAVDRIVKNEEYRDTPSVRRYVMLEQDRKAATMFARVGDAWIGTIVTGDAVLPLPEVGTDLPLAECYEGVETAPAA
jgi:Uma2 family endonuclease